MVEEQKLFKADSVTAWSADLAAIADLKSALNDTDSIAAVFNGAPASVQYIAFCFSGDERTPTDDAYAFAWRYMIDRDRNLFKHRDAAAQRQWMLEFPLDRQARKNLAAGLNWYNADAEKAVASDDSRATVASILKPTTIADEINAAAGAGAGARALLPDLGNEDAEPRLGPGASRPVVQDLFRTGGFDMKGIGADVIIASLRAEDIARLKPFERGTDAVKDSTANIIDKALYAEIKERKTKDGHFLFVFTTEAEMKRFNAAPRSIPAKFPKVVLVAEAAEDADGVMRMRKIHGGIQRKKQIGAVRHKYAYLAMQQGDNKWFPAGVLMPSGLAQIAALEKDTVPGKFADVGLVAGNLLSEDFLAWTMSQQPEWGIEAAVALAAGGEAPKGAAAGGGGSKKGKKKAKQPAGGGGGKGGKAKRDAGGGKEAKRDADEAPKDAGVKVYAKPAASGDQLPYVVLRLDKVADAAFGVVGTARANGFVGTLPDIHQDSIPVTMPDTFVAIFVLPDDAKLLFDEKNVDGARSIEPMFAARIEKNTDKITALRYRLNVKHSSSVVGVYNNNGAMALGYLKTKTPRNTWERLPLADWSWFGQVPTIKSKVLTRVWAFFNSEAPKQPVATPAKKPATPAKKPAAPIVVEEDETEEDEIEEYETEEDEVEEDEIEEYETEEVKEERPRLKKDGRTVHWPEGSLTKRFPEWKSPRDKERGPDPRTHRKSYAQWLIWCATDGAELGFTPTPRDINEFPGLERSAS